MTRAGVEGWCGRELAAGDCDAVLTARRVPVMEHGGGVEVVVQVYAFAGRTGDGVPWSPSTTSTLSRAMALLITVLQPSNMICNKGHISDYQIENHSF